MEEKERFEPVSKESAIGERLHCLDSSLEELDKRIIQLRSQLVPVMSDSEKEKETAGEDRGLAAGCYVLQKLIDFTCQVDTIKKKVECILMRLQI